MNKELEVFKKKFNQIKEIGWIRSIKQGPTGIGATFEKLLGCSENSLEIPDFNGIEIKTKRELSKGYIGLFNMTPTGKYYHEVERLKDTYGYPDKKLRNYKVLNNSVYSDKRTWIGTKFQFMLKLDMNNKIISLCIFDCSGNLIENFIHWDFDEIREKLYRKLKTLAYINAYSKYHNNHEYFYYYKMQIFKLKDFDTFIRLIDNGTIRINFKLGIFRSGKRVGQIHDHGTSFEIKECDLFKLYNKIQ